MKIKNNMILRKLRQDRRIWWIAFALISVLLRVTLPASMIEQIYARGVFPLLRLVVDYTIGWLPFAFVYLLLPALVAWGIFKARTYLKTRPTWLSISYEFTLSLLAFLSAIVGLFLWLWGFNYGRISVENQLGITPQALSFSALENEFFTVTQELIHARKAIPTLDTTSVDDSFLPSDVENEVRKELEKTLRAYHFSTTGKPSVRVLLPKGILLRISTAGVYLPWVGEGHVDGGLHPAQLPFVMTHELAHAYGFGDEGTCNFWAYLSLREATHPFLRYSGILGYWRYLASAVRRQDATNYADFYQTLPTGIRSDLSAIYENSKRYPDLFPKFRDAAYHQYLKAQGIPEGLKNYSRVIMLTTAWRQQ